MALDQNLSQFLSVSTYLENIQNYLQKTEADSLFITSGTLNDSLVNFVQATTLANYYNKEEVLG